MREIFRLYTDVLIRVDQTERIIDQFNNNYVIFGCPANWINYARTHDDGIADKYEAICGHVGKNDKRLSMICDDGVPLNAFRSLWNEEGPNDTVYVRYIYDCLTPAICFYSVNVKSKLKEKASRVVIDLQEYYYSLGVKKEECSILVILNVSRFLSELRDSIPIALANHHHINVDRFNNTCILLAEDIHYDLDLNDEFFSIGSLKSIYHKLPKYSPQKEARLIIPNVFFTSDPVYNPSAFSDNRLAVRVPELKEYAHIINASEADYLICGDYRKDTDDFGLKFVKEREKS